MMRRVLQELTLLATDDPADIRFDSSRYDTMYQVGGCDQGGQVQARVSQWLKGCARGREFVGGSPSYDVMYKVGPKASTPATALVYQYQCLSVDC